MILEKISDAAAETAMVDGNEACVDVAYRVNDVCSIFPITPATSMAELADQWASEGRKNIWGSVVEVVEMQSELGAAGTLHGALQAGALGTSFTSSQGLMLMIPNMFKIAGELTPCVIHVASRGMAANGITIYCDHQDVMAVRQTGFAQLASASVQEAHDFSLISQAATLESRIPFLHFFDGFRTSHEVAKIVRIDDRQIEEMISEDLVLEHRLRGMNPDRPDLRGTVQNNDTYFQSRESCNPFYIACPQVVERSMERFFGITGRRYRLFDYWGHPEAERVLVLMGSGAETARESVEHLAGMGEKVGCVQVRLFRPFSSRHLLAAFPPTVKAIGVLDRTKEPGASGEPLYLDVVSSLVEGWRVGPLPRVIGGRYGLGGKEFHPGMVKAVLDELMKPEPRNHFNIGIIDDLTHSSLDYDPDYAVESDDVHRAVFYGLGSDGTVGANKNTIKIIGEDSDLYAQAYFVYDSKKSGSKTVSHLRFGRYPIRSAYLVRSARFVGCHSFGFIDRMDVLEYAAPGAVLLLNCPLEPVDIWDRLPRPMQQKILDMGIELYVIDATRVARETGLGGRTNTVLQTCFFAISGVLPREEALERIKDSIRKTYGKKGESVVEMNFRAVDATLANLYRVEVPNRITSEREFLAPVPAAAPRFVQDVTGPMIAGKGDSLPVSLLPNDGTYPAGTTRWEKRNIADFVPVWEAESCIQCGNCSFVCPHACIRSRVFHQSHLDRAPDGFQHAPIDAKGFPESRYTLQVYMEDCTGCGLCVEACPVRKDHSEFERAIHLAAKDGREALNRPSLTFFESLPVNDRSYVDFSTVRGSQFLEPTFEFPGSCPGCGETPYVRLLSQLFGDRMMVANASGCSSVYGGCLPTTPWSVNSEGRGPAWANSLFEDNAEFGLGMRMAADRHRETAHQLLRSLAHELGEDLVDDLIDAPQRLESEIRLQRERVGLLKVKLLKGDSTNHRRLLAIADHLVRRSVWIVGGDGWAYDIGSAGVDHVLAAGRDVNLLVLDNEVYANTGGQSSKSTPLGAVAKFANAGKQGIKKDLALQAISYGNVYVARVAMGANPQQTLTAMREAEAYAGPSLILAYSHCIAHGIDMAQGLEQQNLAVHSGYWPLIRFDPELRKVGENPFLLDSARPNRTLDAYTRNELRYRMLENTNPDHAEEILEAAQAQVTARWALYERMAR